jgi:hypothetical protein
VQLSLKVSASVKEQFTAVAAAHGLAFGELLERALEAFVRTASSRRCAPSVSRRVAELSVSQLQRIDATDEVSESSPN